MSARLHIVDPPEGEPRQWSYNVDPGAMFRYPEFDRDGRECWCIALPNKAGLWWTTYEADGSGEMWDVTGVPPNITVSPSINAGDGPGVGNWHGFIKDGEMTP